MIKYDTKTIIKRAEQLADLENSDFISDEEKELLLNESYTELYQQMINANDKYYLKRLSVCNNMQLPSDFFQLAALYTDHDKQQIQKMNASQMHGYDIRNNCLILSSDYDNVRVIMEYYPAPKTLFYKTEKKDVMNITVKPDADILALAPDYYLGRGGTFYNYEGNAINNFGTSFFMFAKEPFHVTKYEYLGKTSSAEYSEKIVLRCAYGSDNESNIIDEREDKPYLIKGDVVSYDEVIIDTDKNYWLVITDETESVYYCMDEDYKIYSLNGKLLYDKFTGASRFYCRQDGLYVGVNGEHKITRVTQDAVEIFSLDSNSFIDFVDGKNCVVRNSIDNNFYKIGYGFNTLLSYPNNSYYVVLSYMLAISFKMKQQGDINLLSAKFNEVYHQFINSLSRDANGYYTMRNIYGPGKRNLWY